MKAGRVPERQTSSHGRAMTQAARDEERDETARPLKLILYGNSGVGKTALVQALQAAADPAPDAGSTERAIAAAFRHAHDTTLGVDFCVLSGFRVRATYPGLNGAAGRRAWTATKVQIWDTAGHERFRTITRTYARNADGVLFVAARDDPAAFAALPSWVADLADSERDSLRTRPVRALVVSKVDAGLRDVRADEHALWNARRREICPHAARDLPHVAITSARTGHGVRALLEDIVAAMLEARWARDHGGPRRAAPGPPLVQLDREPRHDGAAAPVRGRCCQS